MDWKYEAMQDLKQLEGRQVALINLKGDLIDINNKLTALRSPAADVSPVQGGGCPENNRKDALLVERDRKAEAYKTTARQVQRVERALTCLTDQQRDILDKFFMHRTKGYITELCDRYHLEQSQVYRLKDDALIAFTRARYGLVQT